MILLVSDKPSPQPLFFVLCLVQIHLIPLHTMADANFSKKEDVSPEMFKEIASEISRNMVY